MLFTILVDDAWGLGLDDFRKEVYKPDNLPAPNADDSPEGRVKQVIDFFVEIILYASGSIAVLMLIIGGIMYISYLGNDERMEHAKKIIKFALMGLFTVILAFAIVANLIDLIFRATT